MENIARYNCCVPTMLLPQITYFRLAGVTLPEAELGRRSNQRAMCRSFINIYLAINFIIAIEYLLLGIILCTNDRECEQQQHFADVDSEMMEQLRRLFRIDFEMFGYDW